MLSTQRSHRPQGIGLIAVLSAIPFVYMCFFAALRHTPSIGLAIAVTAAFGTLLISRGFFFKPFIPLLVVSIFYLYFSFNHTLPTAWTSYYDERFVLRQWMWAPLLMLFSSSFCVFFLYCRDFLIQHALFILMFCFIAGRLSLFVSPLNMPPVICATIYTLLPENATYFVVLMLWIFHRRRDHFCYFLLLVLSLPLYTSTQSIVLMAVVIGIRYFRLGRETILGLLVIIVAGMLVAPHYIIELYGIDSSSGFRAVLWRDATDAFIGSDYVGVGFGTEYVRNDFAAGNMGGWKAAAEGTDKRMLIGSHNSAFDIALRMGIPGLLAFAYLAIVLARSTMRAEGPDYRLNCSVLTMLLLNNSLNMGVTSINFMFTTALCAGWLMASELRTERLRALSIPRGSLVTSAPKNFPSAPRNVRA